MIAPNGRMTRVMPHLLHMLEHIAKEDDPRIGKQKEKFLMRGAGSKKDTLKIGQELMELEKFLIALTQLTLHRLHFTKLSEITIRACHPKCFQD